MNSRVTIAAELAAKIMYECDKTCCVCRDSKQNIQIHHIDETPSNNSEDNLTTVCLNCHSKIHSDNAFARNYSKELIKLYSESWKKICLLKLEGHASIENTESELEKEVLLEMSLTLHRWKNSLMASYSWVSRAIEKMEGVNIWDALVEKINIEDQTSSKSEPDLLMGPLLELSINEIDRIMNTYESSIPEKIKVTWIRYKRQLNSDKTIYQLVHIFARTEEHKHRFLTDRFKSILGVMGKFDSECAAV